MSLPSAFLSEVLNVDEEKEICSRDNDSDSMCGGGVLLVNFD